MNDGLKYEWTHHDGRTFASQRIEDPENNVSLRIELIKPSAGQGSEWMTRVHVDSLLGRPHTASLVSYAYMDGAEPGVEFEQLKLDVSTRRRSP